LKISPLSYKVVITTTVIFLLLLITSLFLNLIFVHILTFIAGFVFLFNFYFFRDPERVIPQGENLIISPADGKIIKIDEVDEPLFFKGKTKMISIFMSVVSVHVNRIPISGKVEYLDYQTGKFLAAFDHKASDENEQSIIGISDGNRKILFKQIAGVVARRIVYQLNEGDNVKAGDRFGLIHYGSRVDMFFPLDTQIKVEMDQMVTSGESIIGEYK
jgi:phosphatidylserine decarboxylase